MPMPAPPAVMTCQRPGLKEPGPLVTLVRRRSVAKVDSTGLAVRRCTQRSAGGVAEREQLVQVIGDLRGGPGEPGPVCGIEGICRGPGVVLVFRPQISARAFFAPGRADFGSAA